MVFVDDLGTERLLTVFDGLKFSRTRVMAHNEEDILSEIKRSQIDFLKKTEEFLVAQNADLIIVTNSQDLEERISRMAEKLPVKYLNVEYPALEGLKDSNIQFQYRLPEEIIKKRQRTEFKQNITTAILSISVLAVGLLIFLCNRIERDILKNHYRLTKDAHEKLDEEERVLDRNTYREELKAQKSLNYGITYLAILETIPASYIVNTFKFYKTNRWNAEFTLLAEDKGLLEPIRRVKILKKAEIKDIFVNDHPGKRLKLTI